MKCLLFLLIFITVGFSKNVDLTLVNPGETEIKSILIFTDNDEFFIGNMKPNSKDTITLQCSNESIISIEYTDVATNPNEISVDCIENVEADFIAVVNLESSDVVCKIKE